jgi:uncharacterized protein YndB with AHSA1/START domain
MSDKNDLVLERILDAPRALVWKALTVPEHARQWWAPRPYQTAECEIDLRPGGVFYTRIVGPEDFDSPVYGCFLEVAEGERLVWTTALTSGFRPAGEPPHGCGAFIFTAIVTLEDSGAGQTRYRVVVLHKDEADRDTHAEAGFHDGWGTCANQLGEVAAGLMQDA